MFKKIKDLLIKSPKITKKEGSEMSKILITGSSTGLGALAAEQLIKRGHKVFLHARNQNRKKAALDKNPEASGVVIGDLAKRKDVISVAHQVNQLGKFDVIIHNAGVGVSHSNQLISSINLQAPYILTALIPKPKRLIYISSMDSGWGKVDIDHLDNISYADSKLDLLLLTKKVARLWPKVAVNAVSPGFVPTRMGGAGAPDKMSVGYESQVWLADSNSKQASTSGNYYYQKKPTSYNSTANDQKLQDELVNKLAEMTKISIPS